MELMRACLVQATLLRDRDGGTSVHRFGSGRDEMADQVAGLLRCEVDVSPRPNIVERTVELYGQRRHQLDRGYQPNWSGLDALITRADTGDREPYVHGFCRTFACELVPRRGDVNQIVSGKQLGMHAHNENRHMLMSAIAALRAATLARSCRTSD